MPKGFDFVDRSIQTFSSSTEVARHFDLTANCEEISIFCLELGGFGTCKPFRLHTKQISSFLIVVFMIG